MEGYFCQEGRVRKFWLLASYLPLVGLAALVLVLPSITLLDKLGYPSLPTDQAPTSWNSLVRQTVGICLSIASFVIATWIWRKYCMEKQYDQLWARIPSSLVE